MADFKKMRRNLPPPPTEEEATSNLSAPEVAPADDEPPVDPGPFVDRRTLRATGRTHQLATRVKAEFYDELRIYAATHRLKLVEVLEIAFEALKASDASKGK